MSNTTQRIIVGIALAGVIAIVATLQYFGIPAVRYFGVLVAFAMIAEYVLCLRKTDKKILRDGFSAFTVFFLLLCLMVPGAYVVGSRPWIMLLLLMTICAADIGAWFFGRLIGGDKMWERLSAQKTWAGQIAGILCGTVASVLYGLLGTDSFMPQLMWIGIGVSLMSQYGDLTASWIKRKLGIKDFGTILPGHGGILDRFDGWVYALPVVWLIMM